MKFLQFLYTLLERFALTPMQRQELENEATIWLNDQIERGTWVGRMYKDYMDSWYVRTFLAVLFIFAVRWIGDFMNPNRSTQGNNDL